MSEARQPSQNAKVIQGIRKSGAAGPHFKSHKSRRIKAKQELKKMMISTEDKNSNS